MTSIQSVFFKSPSYAGQLYVFRSPDSITPVYLVNVAERDSRGGLRWAACVDGRDKPAIAGFRAARKFRHAQEQESSCGFPAFSAKVHGYLDSQFDQYAANLTVKLHSALPAGDLAEHAHVAVRGLVDIMRQPLEASRIELIKAGVEVDVPNGLEIQRLLGASSRAHGAVPGILFDFKQQLMPKHQYGFLVGEWLLRQPKVIKEAGNHLSDPIVTHLKRALAEQPRHADGTLCYDFMDFERGTPAESVTAYLEALRQPGSVEPVADHESQADSTPLTKVPFDTRFDLDLGDDIIKKPSASMRMG